MSRVDADLVAVRDLPPGVVEPSDEAVAAVWRRISARPAPSARRWPSPRLWVPIAAAATATATVLLLMVSGIVVLRPHLKADPPPEFSSNPAKVTRVFADLIAAARTATPARLRAGQLIYLRDASIFPNIPDGRLYTGVLESWTTPDRLMETYRQRDFDLARPDVLALRRSEESAKYPRPTGADTRPWAKPNDLVGGPTDPAVVRRALLELKKFTTNWSDNRKVWEAVAMLATLDPVLSVARRLALYRVLAAMPVSVAEIKVGGRRLVAVRFAEGDEGHDLLFDPSTGRFAGSQAAYFGAHWPGLSDNPAFRAYQAASIPTPLPTSSGGVVLGVGWPVAGNPLDPGVDQRDLWSWGVVEEVGERP